MSTLYLDRKNLALKHDAGTLAIYQDGERQSTVPLKLIERIVARADVALSAGVLTAIASRGIAFIAITGRKGEYIAQLTGAPHNDARRRLAQYRRYQDPDQRLNHARALIVGKIHNQHRFITRLLAHRPDQRYTLTHGENTLAQVMAQALTATRLESLRGFEGAAAAAYFKALTRVFPERLNFTDRNRRPPRDPVNACLSLGYTLLHGDAVHACHSAGLDPMIGIFHDPVFGRESLAADLVEPLRPHLDQWTWELFKDRQLDLEHFGQEGDACLLSKTGRQRYYAAWEQRAPALRRWLRLQTRQLVRDLLDREPETQLAP
ncbi:MAG: CRISPR-associated endonuclease Cas1 [Thiotrichales bacterium]